MMNYKQKQINLLKMKILNQQKLSKKNQMKYKNKQKNQIKKRLFKTLKLYQKKF